MLCHLRGFRGDRKLRELEKATGVSVARLSQIERGVMLPRDDEVRSLEVGYGVLRVEWYDENGLLALIPDEADA